MESRRLTATMLIVAPIVVIVCFGVLWPAAGTDNAKDGMAAIMAHEALSKWTGSIGTMAFVAIFIAYSLVARFCSENGKPGAPAAVRASIIFPMVGAVVLAGSGLTWGAIEVASGGNMRDAVTVYLVGQNIQSAIGIFWGPAMIAVGIAITRQFSGSMFSMIVGGLLAVIGLAFFVLTFFSNPPGAIWLIVFIGYAVATILLGVRVLTMGEKQAA